MSSPAWACPERASPKWPVTVPDTGVAILPEPQPPAVAAGAGADTVFGAAGAETGAVLDDAGGDAFSRDTGAEAGGADGAWYVASTRLPPPLEPSPRYETVDLNSAAHVFASTSPVTGR